MRREIDLSNRCAMSGLKYKMLLASRHVYSWTYVRLKVWTPEYLEQSIFDSR